MPDPCPPGCDFRADLVPCIDEARKIVECLGLRPEEVQVRTVEWAGTSPGTLVHDKQLGLGGATQIELVTLDPRPVVSDPHPRLLASEPGTYAQGDRIITKVSRDYPESTFLQVGDGTGGEKRERYFLIDGEPYRLVGEPTKKNFEWVLHVRRMRGRYSP